TLNQIRRTLSGARFHGVLSVRSHDAPEDSSFSVSDGRRGALSFLPAAVVDSEFVGFSWAYLIAAVASTLLITWYCRFFLGGGVRTFMIGAGLAGVYLFLYITLG